jgi:hypothetical protein
MFEALPKLSLVLALGHCVTSRYDGWAFGSHAPRGQQRGQRMLSIKVKTSSPKLRFKVEGLSPSVTLVVFGVRPPPEGKFDPVYEVLGTVTTDKLTLDVTMPTQGVEFRHAALKFAVTMFKNDVGTAEIQILRSQDQPQPPDFTPPIHLTVELKRPSSTSPTYVEQSVVLEEDT